MDKLNAYKLDKAFTKGVDIELDDAPGVVFTVRLPSQYNRAYAQALFGAMDLKVGDDGQVNTSNLMTTKYAQEDAFVQHCLIAIDGEEVPGDFLRDYPSAVTELMEKAVELANIIENKVETSVKKSQPTSNGESGGKGRKSSTPSLSSAVG